MPAPALAVGFGKKVFGHVLSVGQKSWVERPFTPEETAYLNVRRATMEREQPSAKSSIKTRIMSGIMRQIWTYGPNEWLASIGVGNPSPVSASGETGMATIKTFETQTSIVPIVVVVAVLGIILISGGKRG